MPADLSARYLTLSSQRKHLIWDEGRLCPRGAPMMRSTANTTSEWGAVTTPLVSTPDSSDQRLLRKVPTRLAEVALSALVTMPCAPTDREEVA